MNRQTYIEPAIRSIVGGFIVILGTLIYVFPAWSWL